MVLTTSLSVVVIPLLLVGRSFADAGDDFSNNLFTDLAPILALFGERVTTQFMSESLGWADCIILAMAPIGIITIIVASIKVGEPLWLKAIIGRARENLSQAEMEVMSSTSQEVCELYNGQSIVRCQGAPVIWEFVCLFTPHEYTGPEQPPNVQVLSLEEAKKSGIVVDGKDMLGWKRLYQRIMTSLKDKWSQARSSGRDENDPEHAVQQQLEEPQRRTRWDITVIREITPDAPNISLNRHDQISRVEIHMAAVFATALQAGVLVFFGFITYSPRLRPNFKKDDSEVADYAFPMAAGGTVLLVLGLLICAHVVESRTHEEEWKPKDEATMQVVWLQQEQTVGDQVFKAFATCPRTSRAIFRTSRRLGADSQGSKKACSSHSQAQAKKWKTLTAIGSFISLFGFFVQFIGLRGMNWAASVAQLSAILIMIIVRAWIRRGLARPLVSQRLSSQFELDWLAMALAHVEHPAGPWCQFLERELNQPEKHPVFSKTWVIDSGFQQQYLPLRLNGSPCSHRAQAVLTSRQKLGKLADFRGPVSDMALRLTSTIEVIANVLLAGQFETETEMSWVLEVTHDGPQSAKVSLQLSRPSATSEWRAYADEIESALSLWVYSAKGLSESEENADSDPQAGHDHKDDSWLRNKGPRSDLGLQILASAEQHVVQELLWWTPDNLEGLLEIEDAGEPERDIEGQLVAQELLRWAPDNFEGLLEIEGTGGVERDITGQLEVGGTRVVGLGFKRQADKNAHGVQQPAKRSFDVLKFSAEDERTRLSESQEQHGKIVGWTLSTGGMASEAEEPRMKGSQRLGTLLAIASFDDMVELYAKDLLYAFMSSVAKTLSGPISGGAENRQNATVPDSNRNWREVALWNKKIARVVQEVQNNGLGESSEAYLAILAPLSMEGKLPFPHVIVDLALDKAKESRRQGRWWEAADAYLWLWEHAKPLLATKSQDSARALLCLIEFFRDVCDQADLEAIEGRTVAYPVLHGLRAYLWQEITATSQQRTMMARLVRLYKDQGRPWATGLSNVLREFVRDRDQDSIEPFGGFAVNELHQSACSKGGMNYDLDFWALLKEKDVSGWVPLHYAAAAGDEKFLNVVPDYSMHGIPNDPTRAVAVNTRDLREWTPLHYACLNGHEAAVRILLEREDLDIHSQGIDGVTPLHCAARSGSVNVVRRLLKRMEKKRSDSPGRTSKGTPHRHLRDNNGRAAIHWAVMAGHDEVVQELEADLELRDLEDWTVLHLAASHNRKRILTWAMKKDCLDMEAVDTRGRTPLLVAAASGRLETVQALLNANANVHIKDDNGDTPLHLAAASAKAKVMKLLLEKDPKAAGSFNNQRETPMQLLEKNKQARDKSEATELLKKNGGDWSREDALSLMLLDMLSWGLSRRLEEEE